MPKDVPLGKSTDVRNQAQFDTGIPSFPLGTGLQLVNKHKAAAVLGVSPETLKRYRLQEGSTLIQGLHYHVWNARVVRYNLALIADWGLNRNNPQAHQKAIEAYLALLPSNQPKKRGRRVG